MIELLLAGAWKYVALGVAVLAALWAARKSGRDDERDKRNRQDLAASNEADKIEQEVAGNSPATNRERLGKWSPR
jgi:cell division septation protein DedD